MNNQGWQCPVCLMCWAPTVQRCDCSKPEKAKPQQPMTQNAPQQYVLRDSEGRLYSPTSKQTYPHDVEFGAKWSDAQQTGLEKLRCRVCFQHGYVRIHGASDECPWTGPIV